MQSLNNLSPRGRQIFIGGVTVFILLPFFYFVYTASSNNNPNKKGTYYDKASGQTVTNNNQTPEMFGVDPEKPTYLGTTSLLDVGVTKYQLLATKTALYNFAKTVSDKPSELSIDVKSIGPVSYDPDSDNPVNETSFTLQVDRKEKYTVKLQYSGISMAHIYVSPINGAQIFDSGEIDGSKISE